MIFANFYGINDRGEVVDAIITQKDNVVTLTIPKERVMPCQYLDIHSPYFTAKAGEEGYFFSSPIQRQGIITRFKSQGDFTLCSDENPTLLIGAKRDNFSIIAYPEGMRYDMSEALWTKDNEYNLCYRVRLGGDSPYEDISVNFYLLPKGTEYSEMAVYYRNLLLSKGIIKPITEKSKERAAVAYAKDAPEIRIRMGWKPAPSPVADQTLENEPPMHVACTFRDVMKFIDELKKAGVDKAQLCLVGWNKSGHDGRWPDAFPVEPLLGGEEGLRELISYAKANGYAIVCHTNSTDAYPISPKTEGNLVLNEQGKEHEGGVWSGGRARRLCPKKALEFGKEILPKVADLGFSGLHYIDVLAVISPMKCANPAHPVSRRETVSYYKELMGMCHELFGGFASEGAYDFAEEYVDYGFYISNNRPPHPLADEYIPLWELIYHGFILYNVSTSTVNVNIRDINDQLMFTEYGGRLSYYVYQKFITATASNTNWLGKDDLTLDGEEMAKTVAVIKEGYEKHKKYFSLQEVTMDKHEIKGDVRIVTFGNGTKLIVNYGDNEYVDGNITVGAKDYLYV